MRSEEGGFNASIAARLSTLTYFTAGVTSKPPQRWDTVGPARVQGARAAVVHVMRRRRHQWGRDGCFTSDEPKGFLFFF